MTVEVGVGVGVVVGGSFSSTIPLITPARRPDT